ncbi:aspartate/glutamate racemase family protein [Pimelobacter simplex]|uniref:aspartate/glutamate racemase family protein n=1 Tax=Nocardioides simplex TaxID=2045 RepID=UPI00215059B4|nr:amino acid racemase [Pimelobacter simplex]UUW88787.1 amino acid racemase [Pimelobacter simplex]UUW98292.1 amino acid racemase [Pimelobacter simplex]
MTIQPSLLGVLGGMGPIATAYFFEQLIAATPASVDQEHIPVVIWSDGRVPDRTDALLGRGPSPVPAMSEGWHALRNAGADLIAIPCNTAHAFLADLDLTPRHGFVDMIAATIEAAAALSSGRVGLFATRGTRLTGLYDRAAQEHGLDLVHVDEDDQENLIDEAIRIVKGGADPDLAERLIEEATRALAASGCDVVLAACTEIPLASRRAAQVLPVVDSVACLADACVKAFAPGR